jgi:hypothetical protein
MRIRTLITRISVLALVAAASGAATGTAQAVVGHGRVAGDCASVTVKANPRLNTAMIPEGIKSSVTNCATTTETMILTQRIAGPFRAQAASVKTWRFTVLAGQTVSRFRSLPYACCGTYYVRDAVSATSGTLLAKAQTSFTFA